MPGGDNDHHPAGHVPHWGPVLGDADTNHRVHCWVDVDLDAGQPYTAHAGVKYHDRSQYDVLDVIVAAVLNTYPSIVIDAVCNNVDALRAIDHRHFHG